MAAVIGGLGGSSVGGGSDDLAPTFAMDEDEKYEEVRRTAGDRGGVALPLLCKEVNDARLLRVGVVERSVFPMELELGALRSGDFAETLRAVEEILLAFGLLADIATGEEGGRGVSTAVERESRSMLSDSAAPSLFIVQDLDLSSDGS